MRCYQVIAIIKGEIDLGYFKAETVQAAATMARKVVDPDLLCEDCCELLDPIEVVDMDVQEIDDYFDS